MRSILVTGAGGHIGTSLVPMSLEQGHGVQLMDRYFCGRGLPVQYPSLEVAAKDVQYLRPRHLASVHAVIDLAPISKGTRGKLFQQATWQMNYRARVRCPQLASEAGAPGADG